MSLKKKERKLRNLINILNTLYYYPTSIEDLEKFSTCNTFTVNFCKRSRIALSAYKLGSELGHDKEAVDIMFWETNALVKKGRNVMNQRPVQEGRDNKGVYVGGGGSNMNKVRYPKKNRNRRTWAAFYKLFPRLAEVDNWDGKTSNKMK